MKPLALVTGASGFLGRRLVSQLTKTANVVALSRSGTAEQGFASLAVDLNDFECLRKSIGGRDFEFVFHLGAQSIVGTNLYRETFTTNVTGTMNLLEVLAEGRSQARVVCASTAALGYETEDNVRSAYAASKRCMEIICHSYADDRELDLVIARLTNIYGPGDCNRSRIVPGTIASVMFNAVPTMRSHLDTRINQLFVDDAIRALLTLSTMPFEADEDRCLTICNTQEHSLEEIVAEILRYMHRDELMPTLDGGTIESRKALSPSRRLRTEGWEASTTLRQGIAQTVDWYQSCADYNG